MGLTVIKVCYAASEYARGIKGPRYTSRILPILQLAKAVKAAGEALGNK